MKKNVEIEKYFCDFCGKESYQWQTCLGCNDNVCHDCGIEYPHGVYASGSGDGLYCLPCDRILRSNGDKLHAAYRKITSLRNEIEGFEQDFRKREEEAGKELKRLREVATGHRESGND